MSFLRLPFLIALAIAAISARAEEYTFSEKIEHTHAFKADAEITLSNTNGSVTIRTWDRPEIKIEGEKRAKTEEELKLISVVIDLSDAALKLKTEFPKYGRGLFGGDRARGSVTLTLTVPATVNVRDLSTVNGSLTIEGVRGPVKAESVNGRINAIGLANNVSLETVNGTITAEFAKVTSNQKISAETVNGSATLKLPKDASFKFRASSVNGSIECDFPIRLEGKAGKRSLSGTIGDGGASIEAETVNGSIRVKQL